ncbi:UNVERIFIED_ORG: MarR family transcriptional regulator [Bacillus sp. AZ43]
MEEPRWLSPSEDRAWRAWRRMHTALPAQLAQDLWKDSRLSDPDFEVLSTLSEATDHRRRLSELAAKMLWSRSRLSHHVTRMQARGLVTRDEDPTDGRGSFVTLTPHGFEILRAAAVHHLSSVRRHLIDLLSEDELDVLATIAERVVDRLDSARAATGEGAPR